MILKAEFEEHIWVKIIDMLATQPYRDVGPLIAALSQQFQAQREPPKEGSNGLTN